MQRKFGCLPRICFLASALLSLFFAVFLFSRLFPFYKSLFAEEDLFYGKITSMEFPWNGRGLNKPLLDRTTFHLNEDRAATFILALQPSGRKAFEPLLNFWAVTEMPAPVGVRAKRVSKLEWVVTGISTSFWELDSSQILEFHERALFWYSLFELFLIFGAFFFFRVSFKRVQ